MACISMIMHRACSSILAGVSLVLATTGIQASESCKPVYLTFDSGNMRDAVYIRDVLRQKNIRATFFVANNKTVKGNRTLEPAWADFWKSLVRDGHVFGNHTWSHHYVRADEGKRVKAVSREGKWLLLNQADYCRELSQVANGFRKISGASLQPMWRAPAGRTTRQTIFWAAECGYPVHVGWTRHGYLGDDTPSERFSNEKLLQKALKNIRENEIVLMHLGVWDRKQPLAPILPELIDQLRARGFCFKQLSIKP